ncbi:DNA-directed RNA polymerase subunit RPC12/RpoP [Arcicella sp. BE140]|nr:DNA-directed RNA polymerase subunit RPC12/RpoP [Arcicella sp. BE51]MDR6813423.1 DNA-directed RNA polymerase subunit RPC12/RpoP [Arcicella sp. BE140]MDR6824736.1 DNA-directed RNA polymerase subunit RPC12/RpoP [Arcicella sp. BE139]
MPDTKLNSIVIPLTIILSNLILFFWMFNIKRTAQNKCPYCGYKFCKVIQTPNYLKAFLCYLNSFKYYKCDNCGNNFILVVKL